MQHVFAFIGNLSCVIGKKFMQLGYQFVSKYLLYFFKQRTQFVSTLIQPGIYICFFHFKASQRDTVYKLFEIK